MCVCVLFYQSLWVIPHRWYFYVTSSLPTMQQGSCQARVPREAAACPFTAANSLSAAFVLSLTETQRKDLKSHLLTALYTSCCLRGPFSVRNTWLAQTLVGFEGSDLIICAFGGFLHPEAQTSIKPSVRLLTDTYWSDTARIKSGLVCSLFWTRMARLDRKNHLTVRKVTFDFWHLKPMIHHCTIVSANVCTMTEKVVYNVCDFQIQWF